MDDKSLATVYDRTRRPHRDDGDDPPRPLLPPCHRHPQGPSPAGHRLADDVKKLSRSPASARDHDQRPGDLRERSYHSHQELSQKFHPSILSSSKSRASGRDHRPPLSAYRSATSTASSGRQDGELHTLPAWRNDEQKLIKPVEYHPHLRRFIIDEPIAPANSSPTYLDAVKGIDAIARRSCAAAANRGGIRRAHHWSHCRRCPHTPSSTDRQVSRHRPILPRSTTRSAASNIPSLQVNIRTLSPTPQAACQSSPARRPQRRPAQHALKKSASRSTVRPLSI